MTFTSIPKSQLNLSIINAFVDSGWKGSWTMDDSSIFIHMGKSLSLEQHIIKNGHIEYHPALRLAFCLGLQIAVLESLNIGILCLNPTDIIVLDENWYILKHTAQIFDMKNLNMIVNKPPQLNKFCAPEINAITSLPAQIYYTSAYYSLALVCIHALDIDPNLYSIFESPLYFIIERCLESNPKDRIFLFI